MIENFSFLQVDRQPPYADQGRSNCFDTKTKENPLNYYKHYSQSACYEECKVDFVLKKCGCRDIFQPRK